MQWRLISRPDSRRPHATALEARACVVQSSCGEPLPRTMCLAQTRHGPMRDVSSHWPTRSLKRTPPSNSIEAISRVESRSGSHTSAWACFTSSSPSTRAQPRSSPSSPSTCRSMAARTSWQASNMLLLGVNTLLICDLYDIRSSPAGMATGSLTRAVPSSSRSHPSALSPPVCVRVQRISVCRESAATRLPCCDRAPVFTPFTVDTTASPSNACSRSVGLPSSVPGTALVDDRLYILSHPTIPMSAARALLYRPDHPQSPPPVHDPAFF
eukprot:762559-Hanusia_phi.AAC.10